MFQPSILLDAPCKVMISTAIGAEYADRMYESRAWAVSYLRHPDPEVRRCALAALACHWGREAAIGPCEQLLFFDPSEDVRQAAMTYLGACYFYTDDVRVRRIAAKIVRDASQAHGLRLTAYKSLFIISRSPRQGGESGPLASSFRFPEDVDWKFVDDALGAAKGDGSEWH